MSGSADQTVCLTTNTWDLQRDVSKEDMKILVRRKEFTQEKIKEKETKQLEFAQTQTEFVKRTEQLEKQYEQKMLKRVKLRQTLGQLDEQRKQSKKELEMLKKI